ncbi:MAG: malate dehydrogenase (oxaloacetate-decarboxylating)(NADP+) [Candidatus Azotimanducaceae bacterium]|jgi:malate dehydrogenase (oxaloacetate-decarboxylating)(NADP+)
MSDKNADQGNEEAFELMRSRALQYHAEPRPGKIALALTTLAENADDLALAYSPGVGEPVKEIANDPELAYKYTAKGNLVGVISNGTAILGLGDRGALASKPVMEGKALLFKRFADVDCFDIEVDTRDVDEFVNTVANIAVTFGGINLEDIAAPGCFEIERRLKEMLDIPVFHDDQHGTAIVTAAGLLNALELRGKDISEARIVCLGAGSAAIAILKLLVELGANKGNIFMLDSKGVVHDGRDDLNVYKQEFSQNTNCRTLTDACKDADVFIGVSGANLLDEASLLAMAPKPVVFAMANPDPEIRPEVALSIRDDVIVATGRSDYPNQVNNVLCFPFMFRGALDVRATDINEEMKMAAVHAIRELAKEEVPPEVISAYEDIDKLSFGVDYIIPKPMDPRLLSRVASAVAQAAIDTGVARIKTVPDYK